MKAVRLLALPVLLVLVWWAVSGSSFYLPSPAAVGRAFAETWFSERLVDDVLPSVGRLLAGYAVAGLLGVALGVPIGLSRRLRATLERAERLGGWGGPKNRRGGTKKRTEQKGGIGGGM
ncbi:hypothetical protein GCM10020220_099320 [Nonomuraea rubra]|uniref:hypothetical protein n=1 Tax=Nonomuraea rubra TaxID=46180 RepID=UPI0031E6751D